MRKNSKAVVNKIINNERAFGITPEALSLRYEKSLMSKTSIYTPKIIVRKMIAEVLRRKKKEFGTNTRIVDFACGTGNFLVEALDLLLRITKRQNGIALYRKEWITGYDIDEKAIRIAKLRIRLICRKHGIRIKDGDVNIKCCDALFDDIGNKYDIVLGNPPYLGEKNNKEYFREIKKSDFGNKYYESKMDLFYYFIHKALDVISSDGLIMFITTNYWTTADYAKNLRARIREEAFFYYYNDINKTVFSGNTGQHNLIFGITKDKNIDEILVEEGNLKFKIENKTIYNSFGKIAAVQPERSGLFDRIITKSQCRLGEIAYINQGIVSGCDKAFVFNEYRGDLGEFLKPFYKNSDIRAYGINDRNRMWILYPDKKEPSEQLLIHLSDFEEKLLKRREVINGSREWFELQWGRDESIFTGEKIVARQRGSKELFGYSNGEFYASADVYFINLKKGCRYSIWYLLGYLNSEIFYKWFFFNGKKKGNDLELYATPLKETPIPDIGADYIARVEELAKEQYRAYSGERDAEINSLIEKGLENSADIISLSGEKMTLF